MTDTFAAVLRIAAFLAVAFGLSYGLPTGDVADSSSSVFNALLLLSFLSGFFINRALERRKTLWNATEVELSRLRRLYNLSASVDDRAWGSRLHQALLTYHKHVGAGLREYGKARDEYRDLAMMVYRFDPKTDRDRLLWQDMLQTTRDVALERRPLERSLGGGLQAHGWAVYLTIAGSAGILMLLNRGHGFTSFSVGLTLAGVLAVVDLLRRTDRLSRAEFAKLEETYRVNVPDA
jgi:hypothetical protein